MADPDSQLQTPGTLGHDPGTLGLRILNPQQRTPEFLGLWTPWTLGPWTPVNLQWWTLTKGRGPWD